MAVRLSHISAVVTDIEGTTTPIAFVKDTLFPYARANLRSFLETHGKDPTVERILAATAAKVNGDAQDLDLMATIFATWIDEDLKIPFLKDVQGLIWAHGYAAGALKGDLFDDAVQGLRAWAEKGIGLAIYSSGSVLAQKLLFGHTRWGDLSPLFTHFFDTAIGPKRAATSYQGISSALKLPARGIVFLSDVAEELDAAAEAGLNTVHIVRPGEGTVATSRHSSVSSFSDIELSPK